MAPFDADRTGGGTKIHEKSEQLCWYRIHAHRVILPGEAFGNQRHVGMLRRAERGLGAPTATLMRGDSPRKRE